MQNQIMRRCPTCSGKGRIPVSLQTDAYREACEAFHRRVEEETARRMAGDVQRVQKARR